MGIIMNVNGIEEIGYIKYSGEDVKNGIIDAASAGSALLGLDEAIRFFNERQSSKLAKYDYQIPVKIGEGSWVAYVMGCVGIGAGAFALSYLKKAGEKMAENDIGDKGLSDVLKKSVEAIQSFIRLVKHTKSNNGWDTKKVKWNNDNSIVGIPNNDGEYIYIPTEYFIWITETPPKLLSRITTAITNERSLSVGLKEGEAFIEEKITNIEKVLFLGNELIQDDEEFLFPEFEHGQEVKLEGKLIRGNEASNSVGFDYEGHILNCLPEEGSVVQFKPALFLKCIIEGTITRFKKNSRVAEKRPRIILKRVLPLESDESI